MTGTLSVENHIKYQLLVNNFSNDKFKHIISDLSYFKYQCSHTCRDSSKYTVDFRLGPFEILYKQSSHKGNLINGNLHIINIDEYNNNVDDSDEESMFVDSISEEVFSYSVMQSMMGKINDYNTTLIDKLAAHYKLTRIETITIVMIIYSFPLGDCFGIIDESPGLCSLFMWINEYDPRDYDFKVITEKISNYNPN